MALVNPQLSPEAPNTRAWRAAEIPAANGQASAMGLARLYGALANGGELDGVRLMKPETIGRMTTAATSDGRKDMFLGFVDGWAMGMLLNKPGVYGAIPRAFGHSGWAARSAAPIRMRALPSAMSATRWPRISSAIRARRDCARR